jgi:beta-phosphoglucomutase
MVLSSSDTTTGTHDTLKNSLLMPEFDAILFDFDGVLLDSEPVHCACWAEVLAPVGVTLEWEFYGQHSIGVDDREMLRMVAARSDPPRNWEELWGLYPAKKKLFQARMAQSPPFEPSLAGFLARLHDAYKLAVVSSSSTSEVEPILVAGGIRQYFDTLVGGEDVTRHKPAPDPYVLAARRLGVRAALVVEDSEIGIASGRDAGFEVVVVKGPADLREQVLGRLAAGPRRANTV